jgi:hypothetical protein
MEGAQCRDLSSSLGYLERLGLLDAWYRHRQEAIEQIARDWLEEHKLAYK